jgi:cell fate (sporulation/competence/biofilm development) regulator YlbF (YheA/YmcA/DUF963 family)
MQITINLNDKLIAQQVGYMVENEVTENFSNEVLKAVGINEKELIKACLADEKFMKAYTKEITSMLNRCADSDILYDAICEMNSLPLPLAKAYKECNRAMEAVDKAERIQRKARELKEAVAVLEAAGFNVTKKA